MFDELNAVEKIAEVLNRRHPPKVPLNQWGEPFEQGKTSLMAVGNGQFNIAIEDPWSIDARDFEVIFGNDAQKEISDP